ncbi:MAG: hypothetical protein JNK54_07975 [Elusimicrobia bacterium]|nr:hypothetical protein [Elusimicrobiota bacterium]
MTEHKETSESQGKCCSDKPTSRCSNGVGCRCFKAFFLVLLGFLAGFFLSRKCPWNPMKCNVSNPVVSRSVTTDVLPVETEPAQ